MIDTPRLAAELGQQLGIRVRTLAGSDKDGLYVDLSPAGVPLPDGFQVHLRLMWRTVDASVVPGNYARGLLAAMASSGATDRALFQDIATNLISKGGKVALAVNGQDVDWKASSEWPSLWNSFGLRVMVSPIGVDPSSPESIHSLALWWGGGVMALMLSLLPLAVSAEPSSDDGAGLPEGAIAKVLVNRYERNPLNRAACIMAHGLRCLVCGTSLEDAYGPVGAGYIQVHHLTPVADMGPDYVVHPARDLIPVCPNCHAMMHQRNPPYSPDELRGMLAKRRQT
jgi:5-methylcytosine-specific restriction protein A